MKLTREQAIMEHRKMWNWIADETLRLKRRVSKDNYFEAHLEHEYDDKLVNDCFLCDYVKKEQKHTAFNGLNCNLCPLSWDSEINYRSWSPEINCRINVCPCDEQDRLYKKWRMTAIGPYCDDYKYIADIARRIAELPEKE